jgi:transcriptional regulator with XRE-family HTH domain
MADERDVLGEILAYLTGEAELPAFDDLPAGERDEAEALLEGMKAAINVDFDGIPNYEDDPVAVRLGFRSGPQQARVYGPTIRKLRERAGLTGRDLATAVSATGRTVDASWVNNLESGTWTTITAVEAEAIAGAVGVEERTLGDPSVPGGVIDRIATTVVEEHNQLTVSRFTEPFGDAFERRLLVSFVDLRILLIVCSTDQEREAAVCFGVACVVDADRYVAIAAVADDFDLTTWLVRPGDVLEHYDTPAGTHTRPGAMPGVAPTTLRLALGKIIEGEVIRWPAFDLAWATVAGASDELRTAAKQTAFKKFTGSAGRVAIDRRPAFQSVGEPDLERADRFISALLAGTSTETVDDYLAEVEQAS